MYNYFESLFFIADTSQQSHIVFTKQVTTETQSVAEIMLQGAAQITLTGCFAVFHSSPSTSHILHHASAAKIHACSSLAAFSS